MTRTALAFGSACLLLAGYSIGTVRAADDAAKPADPRWKLPFRLTLTADEWIRASRAVDFAETFRIAAEGLPEPEDDPCLDDKCIDQTANMARSWLR